jgi:hypothetical protein
MTLGGPIKEDVAHFFFAYEGKKIDSPRQVLAQRTDLLPNAGIVPSLLAQQGAAVSSFKENLFLLKVDAQIDARPAGRGDGAHPPRDRPDSGGREV